VITKNNFGRDMLWGVPISDGSYIGGHYKRVPLYSRTFCVSSHVIVWFPELTSILLTLFIRVQYSSVKKKTLPKGKIILPEHFFWKKFLITEGGACWGPLNMFLIAEFSYMRVSYKRGFFSNVKEHFWQGNFFLFLIAEVSYRRVSYKRRVLY
jgi:hypothetical protein